jgi:hypothetical protein
LNGPPGKKITDILKIFCDDFNINKPRSKFWILVYITYLMGRRLGISTDKDKKLASCIKNLISGSLEYFPGSSSFKQV